MAGGHDMGSYKVISIHKPNLDGIVIGITINNERAPVEIKDDSVHILSDANCP